MALLNYTNYQPISGAGAPLPINMDSVAVSVVDSHNMTMVIKWRGGGGSAAAVMCLQLFVAATLADHGYVWVLFAQLQRWKIERNFWLVVSRGANWMK